MGISPIVAIPRLLETLSLSKEDVDVYEVGEPDRIGGGSSDRHP